MIQDYAEHMLTGNEEPHVVYYAKGTTAATRRQHKRDMLLTFITYSNNPRPKRKHRTAPVKPSSLLKTLVSLFV
jgi:hypothetical protein